MNDWKCCFCWLFQSGQCGDLTQHQFSSSHISLCQTRSPQWYQRWVDHSHCCGDGGWVGAFFVCLFFCMRLSLAPSPPPFSTTSVPVIIVDFFGGRGVESPLLSLSRYTVSSEPFAIFWPLFVFWSEWFTFETCDGRLCLQECSSWLEPRTTKKNLSFQSLKFPTSVALGTQPVTSVSMFVWRKAEEWTWLPHTS